MESRTHNQEQKYNQALGYVYGVKDATPFFASNARQVHSANTVAFATYYSMLKDVAGFHLPLEDAFKYFSGLKLDEQEAYGSEWMRGAFSPYEYHRAIMDSI